MEPTRKHLVLCRAGEGSLHRAWIGDPATRSYDVWLDCYCDPARWAGEAAHVADGRGTTKWPRIAALLAAHPALFEAYDAVWFPDDDLRIDAASVERFFAIFARHRLALAQPALEDRCYWSHELTIESRAFILRYVNFVEVMGPAFSREALRACAPTFGESGSGWGIDYVWSRVLGDPLDRIAIVDATPMAHTRPLGGAGTYDLAAAEQEMSALARRYGVALPFHYRHHGGVRRPRWHDGPAGGGRVVSARLPFWWWFVLGAPPSQRWRKLYWKRMRRTAA